MSDERETSFNLAIETSGRIGSVTLGRDNEPLESHQLPEQRRHNVDLLSTIDTMCRRHSARPASVDEVYVSIGPGSFTGLRIALSTANTLGLVTGAKLVAVPTLDVVAQNAPSMPSGFEHVAVCLNLKRRTMWTGLFDWDGDRFSARAEPALLTLDELLARAPRPLSILGDPLPDFAEHDRAVSVLSPSLAIARSITVWRLGRTLAQRGRYTDPTDLRPLYVRPPEAEQLWNERHGIQGSESVPKS